MAKVASIILACILCYIAGACSQQRTIQDLHQKLNAANYADTDCLHRLDGDYK